MNDYSYRQKIAADLAEAHQLVKDARFDVISYLTLNSDRITDLPEWLRGELERGHAGEFSNEELLNILQGNAALVERGR